VRLRRYRPLRSGAPNSTERAAIAAAAAAMPAVLATCGRPASSRPTSGSDSRARSDFGQPVKEVSTSSSAPLWGGLIALADQDAHHDLGFVNHAIYRIGRGSRYHQAFHDVTTGTNGGILGTAVVGYQAGPGWDPATGWGTPNAQVLSPLLARRMVDA
jgi:hypothetical protein